MQKVAEGEQEVELRKTTVISRDDFLCELDVALKDQPELIAAAHALIMSDEAYAFIGDLNDPRIVMAVELNIASSFEMGTPHPSLAQLAEWLLESTAYSEVAELKDRLEWIRDLLSDYGNILPDEKIEVSSRVIYLIRILSESP